jgi:hypothetical protein
LTHSHSAASLPVSFRCEAQAKVDHWMNPPALTPIRIEVPWSLDWPTYIG